MKKNDFQKRNFIFRILKVCESMIFYLVAFPNTTGLFAHGRTQIL